MTQPAKSQEPSMEEILASIRRIIADDDATKPTPHAPDAAAQVAEPALSSRQSAAPAPRSPAPAPSHPAFEPEVSSTATDPDATADIDVHDESSDILELTESMAAPMPAPPSPMPAPAPEFRTIDGRSDLSFDEATEKPVAQGNIDHIAADFIRGSIERGRLVSSQTSAAVDSAFNSLAQTVLVHNARTLEDLVREMLRPMLKSWLDDNLPGMVERLVRAEIERVSRGR